VYVDHFIDVAYKGFCARLEPHGKSRSLQVLLESTKINRGSHEFFSRQVVVNLDKNCDISIFL